MAPLAQLKTRTPNEPAPGSDAKLVAESLAGSREAFGIIVERYQTLICSLAYSATGNVSQSEDVAQETFLTAWMNLRSLREPGKIRAWLCGIVRNRIHRSLRSAGREPVCGAAALEEAHEPPAPEEIPSERTIHREEEALLWRSLENIPQLYREPLILFYRQHQSIERVAAELELPEDTVKQRLSRGRKLLQEEVQAFVESTLCRTAPGPAFSSAVLAALPWAAGAAASAGIGAGAKGAAAAKSGLLGIGVALFIGILAGIAAQWLLIRVTTTDPKRRVGLILRTIVCWVPLMTVAIAGPKAVFSLRHHYDWNDRGLFIAMAGFWWGYVMVLQTLLILAYRGALETRRFMQEAHLNSRPAIAPGTLLVVVVGTHLMLFSWLVRLAWRTEDIIGAGTTVGLMLVMGLLAFFRARNRAGTALVEVTGSHVAWCSVLMLAVFNWRFDVWLASASGLSATAPHPQSLAWVVPVLSLALVIWSGLLLTLTRAKPHTR